MARTKAQKIAAAKRKFQKYRKKGNFRMLPKRSMISYGFPKCQLVRMTYFEQIRLDPGIGGIAAPYVFRANSVYDPNHTAGGHQPMFHDQYSAVYNHYKVAGSKITITGTNDYSDQNNSMGNLITVVTNNESTGYTSITEACEAKGAKYRQCQEKRPFKLVHKFSATKFFCKNNLKDCTELHGRLGDTGVGTNPGEQAYFVINAFPLYSGQNSYPACLNVRIDYLVLVYDIKKMSTS